MNLYLAFLWEIFAIFHRRYLPFFRYFQKIFVKKYVLKGKEKMAYSRSPPHKIIFILEKYDATATIISACTGRTKHILDRRKNGYATVAMTKYYDVTEEPTLPTNLGTHSIYFYAE